VVLRKIADNPRSTLTVEKKNAEYYKYAAFKTYLEELTKFDFFKYVLFVEGDVFKGFVNARSLLRWFSEPYESGGEGDKIIAKISNWNLDEIPGLKE
jgi:hypothetical protein